jgi:uncharacterized protein (TIGR02594 family)
MQCPANAPAWLQLAWKEIGTKELPENRGPAVQRYIDLAHCGQQGDPWCAIFANAMIESAGLHGTRSASSQSFRSDGNFVALAGPALGAIAVYWRNSKSSGLGHVGFYCGERGGSVYTLGGNEGDMVQIEFLAKAAPAFGLEGYYWPRTVAMPAIVPLLVAATVPANQVSVT